MLVVRRVGLIEHGVYNLVSAIYMDTRLLKNIVVRVDIVDTISERMLSFVSGKDDLLYILTNMHPYGFQINNKWEGSVTFSIVAISPQDLQFLDCVASVEVVDGVKVRHELIFEWLMLSKKINRMQHVVECRTLDAERSIFRLEHPMEQSYTLLGYCCSKYSFWCEDVLYCVSYARWKSGTIPKELAIQAYEVCFEDVDKARVLMTKHVVLGRK